MIMALVDLIRENQKPGMVTAEVGCWTGNTTIHYAPIIKEIGGRLIVVDWFKGSMTDVSQEPYPIALHSYRPNLENDRYQDFLDQMKDYLDIIEIQRGKSHEMAVNIPDGSLDLCFIDADHSYSGVKRDIELYLPKVKAGGILCGHDMEGLNYANTFTPEELERDGVRGVHAGVIQAVFDSFGTDIETRPDYRGDGVPIWIKRL